MNTVELDRGLRDARSCEAWVEQLAAYFESRQLAFGHGTDNASDEAYWLVRGVQQWSPSAWDAAPEQALVPVLLDLAGRRVEERKPLAYLLGEAWFAGLKLRIDEHVLIPRSPLAELIEAGFQPWCSLSDGDRVLDIGTGSGCLAIATACHCPDVRVDATEISPAALRVAAENVARHGLQSRVRLLEANLYPEPRAAYRLIVSNPPYVPQARLEELPPEYRHEPRAALDGGADGLAVVSRILARAADHLLPGGVLVLEVGEAESAFIEAYPRLPVTWLEFERGGEGVLVVSREQLTGHSPS
ncbi:MAG TPA: 50S ribosomal protein L3 N(5)-glutamine methyltransferase [Gammaproteobacteria bacterium]|jgi:ribosomal protein L3 glutamine methyltransferase